MRVEMDLDQIEEFLEFTRLYPAVKDLQMFDLFLLFSYWRGREDALTEELKEFVERHNINPKERSVD